MAIIKTDKKNKDGLQQYIVRVNMGVSPIDGKRHKKQKTVYGLQLAKSTERLFKLERDPSYAAQIITLNDWHDVYLKDKAMELRASTMMKKRQVFDNHIRNYPIGKMRIANITTADIQKWKNEVNAAEDIGLRTKQNVFVELKATISYATLMGIVSNNPALAVPNFKDSTYTPREKKVYSKEEFDKYIKVAYDDAVATGNWDYYVFFLTLWCLGCRKSEALAMD